MIPVKPPVTNVLTKPILNNIAGVKRTFPCHNVVMYLKALTAEGIAINKVVNTNTDPKNGFIPVIYMW